MKGVAEEVKNWIDKAEHDLGTAIITYKHIPEYFDTITFHCQQAVEKYLKAFLIFHSMNFRYTHDSVYLLDLIDEKYEGFKKFYDVIAELQGYAVEVRYPNETIFLSDEKVKNSISTAKLIREIVLEKVDIRVEKKEIFDDFF